MYMDTVYIIIIINLMALQIANPVVVKKVERLAKVTGLTKTGVVEQAVDRMLRELDTERTAPGRLDALLAQLDRIPDRTDAHDPLEWDELGLPR
jgi:antitoxin VapB